MLTEDIGLLATLKGVYNLFPEEIVDQLSDSASRIVGGETEIDLEDSLVIGVLMATPLA